MKKIMKLGLVIAMVLSLVNVPFMAEVKALSGYENIALNKTVSANSTHSSKNIAYAVDGKVVEKQTWQVDYSTGSDYNRGNGNLVQEFIIDLGGNALINQIDLTWTKTVWAKSVKVEGSFDGVDYFLIKEVNDNSISEEMEKQMIEFDLTKTKYVKLTFNEPNNKTYGYEFYEVEVFGEMLENLALNKTVSVPSTAGNKSAAYLTDGKVVDKETWQVAYVAGSDYNRGDGNTTQSIQLDLLKECIINEMDLTWATTVWAKSIKVEGSLDGAEYFTMKEISDNVISADKERQIIALDDVKTRYIKVTFDEPNNKTYGYELYEFEVYGVEAASDRIELEPVYESIKNVSPTIAEDGETIILPSIPYEDYEVIIYGSSNESVIGCDGTIYQPLVDTTVNISYKIVNKNNPEDCFYNDYDEASIVIPGLYEAEANDNEKPIVLPEIQEWKGLSGTFTLSENTKLVASDESLVDTLELVQFYFKEMLNREIEVVVGTPSSEDIYFTLSEKTELGQEGYIANIDETVSVEAYANKGIQYAGATLVQILAQSEHKDILPKGIIRDYPAFAVRSMMIDVGRYYIPLDYMEEIGKYMSYFKMSEFHVHLNDNGGEQSYGFRLQSEKYPQINSNLDPDHVYTKEAYKAFQKELIKFGIDVITEIDTPAHSGFLNLYDSSMLMNSSHMDLSDGRCLEFVKSLLDEYLDGDDPVIQSENFHIGVDEYPVKYSDLARQYCDELIKYVNAKGYKTRMWGAFGSSSGLAGTYEVTTDVICNYWSPNYSNPKQMIEDGYAAINNNRTYLYEVPSSDLDRNKFSVSQGWDNWDVVNVPGVTLSNSSPMLYGAESAFWYDNEAAYSEFDSWEVLKGMALLIAEKAWVGKDEEKTAKEFEETIELVADYAPGGNPSRYVETKSEEIVNYDFEEVEGNVVKDASLNNYDATLNGLKVEEVDGNNVLKLEGTGSMSLPFDAKGLNYSVSFDLTLDEMPAANAVLFDGEYADGTFYLNYENQGEMVFIRKDYKFKFNFNFEKGKTYHFLLTCDTNDTALYVNGVLVSKAIAQVDAARKTTFVLPTAEIGSGIVGTLDNFVLLNKALSYDEILGFEENTVDNLALNKPTTVSGLETDDGRFTSDLAVDGDSATRVSLEKKDDAWFMVDLEDTYWIESIEVAFGELPSGFQLYVSEDGNEWTMVHEDTACEAGTAFTFNKEFTTGIKARYVKYQQLGMFTASNGRNYSGNFNEFRVWGAKENVIQDALQQAKDILANTQVTAENEAFLTQLQASVDLIENTLETSEELKLSCITLKEEIKKFNAGNTGNDTDKEALKDLLTNKAAESIYQYEAYAYYYKQAILAYINSSSSQERIDEIVADMNAILSMTNYALNGEIISYNGLTPERINDGQKPARGNYWDSDGDAQDSSIVVKLTDKVKVSRVVVIPYFYRSDYYYNYEVLVSAEGENWTSVAVYTDKTGKYNDDGQTFLVDLPTAVEYVKIQGIGSNNANKIHITELEVYGEKYVTVDKTALVNKVAEVEAMNAEDYTVETWTNVEAAVETAKSVVANENATQAEVDAALEAIEAAVDALATKPVKPEVDRTGLKDAIKAALIEFEQEEKYTVESFNVLDQCIVDAMNVVDEPDVTQEVLDEVEGALRAAIAGLVEKPVEPGTNVANKDALAAAITAAEALTVDEYTAETWAAVAEALDAAKAVAAKEDATQEEVDAAKATLEAAVKALEEKPQIVAPLAVENLKAVDKAYNKVALTWEPSEGATEYDVYQKAHDSEKFEFVATVTESSYTATVKMTGKENKFYVVAKNEAGASDASKVVAKATTLHGTVKLNMKKVSTVKFELSWNKIAGATRYIIYSKRGSDEWKKVLTLGKDKLSYVTAELPNGEYSYIIRAARYDSSDRVMTAKSNAKTGTVEAIAPTVSVKVSGTKATLTWDKLEGVTYYQVFRKVGQDGKYEKIKTTSAQKYTANVSKTKTYYFKVRGYKAYKSGVNTKYNVYTPYSAAKAVKAK